MMNEKLRLRSAFCAVCAALSFGLFSCSEELDKWEVIEADATCSLASGTVVPFEGGNFTMDVQTNSGWSVTVPEWIKVDNATGTGNATLNFSVDENTSEDPRSASVSLSFGGIEPTGNVAGSAQKKFGVKQEAKSQAFDFRIVKATLDRQKTDEYVETYEHEIFYYYNYIVTVTYEIDSRLSDEELAEILDGAWFTVKTTENTPGHPENSDFHDKYFIDNIPITGGTHTVTKTFENNEPGDWVHLAYKASVNLSLRDPDGNTVQYEAVEAEITDSHI